ncbi:hypothetical protein [Nocardiopsis lambiniae]|uniref:Anti-sigma factor n=1 Tax=Nocardiopsis lambiniae TaxID=3075539 RepID=A0ABU2MB36_9ACTN|nr:hypothetical protein [Nocardiopsis sp. DSM 44743]MDT0329814.1 hypothetical protein [Nocardiopsis sp. DSM 44743]
MEHPDADRLAALAARLEAPVRAEQAHIEGCAHCAEEVERFRATITLMTSGDREPLVSPPERVWDRVLAELDMDEVPEPDPGRVGPDSPAGCGR